MKKIQDFFRNRFFRNGIEITLGCLLLASAFYFFLSPAQLVTGGVTGISIILEALTGLSATIYVYIADIICLFIGLIFLGKTFFIKTVYATLLFPTFSFMFELLHINNNIILDKLEVSNPLLIAFICGAVLSGVGLGLVIRSGATTGGMDVPQKVLSSAFHLPFSWTMYATDGLIILLGITKFGIERGIFAILTMLLTGYLIDVFAVGGLSKRAAYIITNKPDEIKEKIFLTINRGITEVDVIGGYTNKNKTMLICIMHRAEYYKVKNIVDEIDPSAFMFITSTKEVVGEGFSREE